MRSKIYLIGLALWLAFCVVAPAYDAHTLSERPTTLSLAQLLALHNEVTP